MTITKPKEVLKDIKNQGLENWLHNFLNNEGDNPDFSTGLKLEKRYYLGPVNFRLDLVNRICGPEPEMIYKIDPDYFQLYISKMKKSVESGWEIPPLIINYDKGMFTLNDGNHRHAALTSMGIESYWVILWTTEDADFKELKSLNL